MHFKALQKNKAVVVAEAEDLENLEGKLEALKIDPRSVRIISSRKPHRL